VIVKIARLTVDHQFHAALADWHFFIFKVCNRKFEVGFGAVGLVTIFQDVNAVELGVHQQTAYPAHHQCYRNRTL
jgi:hypothetical protein